MDGQEMMKELRAQASEKYRENMIRMGIPAENSIGVATSVVRGLAKKAGKSQELAFELWNTKYHEARMLAVLLMNPKATTDAEAERLLLDVVSWDLCDHLCKNLFLKMKSRDNFIAKWIREPQLYKKRAALLLAHEWMEGESKVLRWIGKDTAKELETMVKAEGRGRLISANTRMGKESGGSG